MGSGITSHSSLYFSSKRTKVDFPEAAEHYCQRKNGPRRGAVRAARPRRLPEQRLSRWLSLPSPIEPGGRGRGPQSSLSPGGGAARVQARPFREPARGGRSRRMRGSPRVCAGAPSGRRCVGGTRRSRSQLGPGRAAEPEPPSPPPRIWRQAPAAGASGGLALPRRSCPRPRPRSPMLPSMDTFVSRFWKLLSSESGSEGPRHGRLAEGRMAAAGRRAPALAIRASRARLRQPIASRRPPRPAPPPSDQGRSSARPPPPDTAQPVAAPGPSEPGMSRTHSLLCSDSRDPRSAEASLPLSRPPRAPLDGAHQGRGSGRDRRRKHAPPCPTSANGLRRSRAGDTHPHRTPPSPGPMLIHVRGGRTPPSGGRTAPAPAQAPRLCSAAGRSACARKVWAGGRVRG